MKPVLNKADYYIRWQNQEFGNKLRSWACFEDIAPYNGLVTMRHVEPNSKLTKYEIPVTKIKTVAVDVLSNYRFNESAPDKYLLAQGEICYNHKGWNLFWSTEKTQMRNALLNFARTSTGVVARETLKHYCCPGSFSDIEALVELYPDHVIEFGCYARPLGNIAHRNTIIWEVRKY